MNWIKIHSNKVAGLWKLGKGCLRPWKDLLLKVLKTLMWFSLKRILLLDAGLGFFVLKRFWCQLNYGTQPEAFIKHQEGFTAAAGLYGNESKMSAAQLQTHISNIRIQLIINALKNYRGLFFCLPEPLLLCSSSGLRMWSGFVLVYFFLFYLWKFSPGRGEVHPSLLSAAGHSLKPCRLEWI